MVDANWISAPTSDGAMRLYLARPRAPGPHPGVVVVQDLLGVDEHIREVTWRLARSGFVAAAPALFHRSEVEELRYEDAQDSFELIRWLTDEQKLADLRSAATLLERLPEVRRGAVGLVGFCFGGQVAHLAATSLEEFRAAVCFSGLLTSAENERSRTPLLFFFGERDPHVTPQRVRALEETLTRLGRRHQVVTYPRAGHRFMDETRHDLHDPEAAADAWLRTLAFLRQELGASPST